MVELKEEHAKQREEFNGNHQPRENSVLFRGT